MSKITNQDIETVHSLSCDSCGETMYGDTTEELVDTANNDGWKEKGFSKHFHGILCPRCVITDGD